MTTPAAAPTEDHTPGEPGIDPHRPPAPPRDGIFFGAAGLRAGWGIAIFVLLFGVCMGLEVLLLKRVGALPPAGPHIVSPRMTLWNEVPACVSILLITLVLAKIEHRPADAYGLGGRQKIGYLAAGLLWGLACLSLLVTLLSMTGLLRFDGRLLAQAAALRYAVVWAGCFLLVGLFEETFLRGYLQFTLARGLSAIYGALLETPHRDAFGFWTAALLLSLLFGAGHHGNAGESPIGLLSATLAGLVFCLSLWRTGSLWWAIGFHAAWDWSQSFLYGVADSGIVSARPHLATQTVGPPHINPWLTRPQIRNILLPVLALIAAIIVMTLHQAPRLSRLNREEATPDVN